MILLPWGLFSTNDLLLQRSTPFPFFSLFCASFTLSCLSCTNYVHMFACAFPHLPPEEDLISSVPFSSLYFIKTPTSLLIRYLQSVQERQESESLILILNAAFVFVNFCLSPKVLNFSDLKISGSSSRSNLICNSWEHLEIKPRTSICTCLCLHLLLWSAAH